jgi:protein-S-isoprenylcysteine O-methyltransferase Ste14
MKRIDLPALIHVVTYVVVMGIALATRATLPVSRGAARGSFSALFALGMGIFGWAAASLGRAFLGNVEPVTDHLATGGPYRWVRHPLYLAMVVTALAISLGTRSLWGLVGTIVLFLPSAAYRAAMEERCLADRFGGEWAEYVARTRFMVPGVW